ncbi:hypothetical protein [Dokdonella sp.]|uniref:hypothetical protein n=1 Tax=Dokdonella sp. TaxID=2291710 RepID=UPI003C61AFB3
MLRQTLLPACIILSLCMLPACSSPAQQDNEPVADESADASATQKKKTVFDEQLKALDKAKAVQATLDEAKAARDKAIDEGG